MSITSGSHTANLDNPVVASDRTSLSVYLDRESTWSAFSLSDVPTGYGSSNSVHSDLVKLLWEDGSTIHGIASGRGGSTFQRSVHHVGGKDNDRSSVSPQRFVGWFY